MEKNRINGRGFVSVSGWKSRGICLHGLEPRAQSVGQRSLSFERKRDLRLMFLLRFFFSSFQKSSSVFLLLLIFCKVEDGDVEKTLKKAAKKLMKDVLKSFAKLCSARSLRSLCSFYFTLPFFVFSALCVLLPRRREKADLR